MIFQQWNFPVKDTGDELELRTKYLQLNYNKRHSLQTDFPATTVVGISSVPAWHYGDPTQDLGGTARTLDQVNGACELEPGTASWFGSAVLDDSEVASDDRGRLGDPEKERSAGSVLLRLWLEFPPGIKGFLSPLRQNSDASEICTRKLVEPLLALQ